MAFNRLSLIKLAEMILAIAIYWLHYNTWEADQFVHLFIITTAFAGFLVVTVGTFLGLITNNGIAKTVDLFFCIAGAILYITAGALSIQHYQGWKYQSSSETQGLVKGSLAIIQGALFILDAFFTFRSGHVQ